MAPDLVYPENVIPSQRFQFCPLCRSPLVISVPFDDNIPRVTCPACGWIHTPVNNAAVAVVVKAGEDGIVGILPPGMPPEAPAALPAGLVEYAESPEEAAIRETREETGLIVEIVRCLGWFFHRNYTGWPGPVLYFMFEAQVVGGELKGSDEGPARIFPVGEFPPISPERAGSYRAMQMYLAEYDR